MSTVKDISAFVDESGSFDTDRVSSRYYFVCMVFHDQGVDLTDDFRKFDDALTSMGLTRGHCVHAGPLIRREKEYSHLERKERRGILDRMLAFLRKIDISYACFKIDKSFLGESQNIHDPLLQQMVQFLIGNAAAFNSYEKIKVYYARPFIKTAPRSPHSALSSSLLRYLMS